MLKHTACWNIHLLGEEFSVDLEMHPNTGNVTQGDGPGPSQVSEEGVDAPRLSHDSNPGG